MSRSSTAPRATKPPVARPQRPGFFARLWGKVTGFFKALFRRTKQAAKAAGHLTARGLAAVGGAVDVVAGFAVAGVGLIGTVLTLGFGLALGIGMHLLRGVALILATPAMLARRDASPWSRWLAVSKMWLTPRLYAAYVRMAWDEQTNELSKIRERRASASGPDLFSVATAATA